MKKFLLIFILSLIFSVQLHAQNIDSFKWLEGKWAIKYTGGAEQEEWKIMNDSTFKGESSFIKPGGHISTLENIELAYRRGNWYYIPTVHGQNGTMTVEFKLICIQKDEFIAENKAHDFPQRIAYRRIGDKLFASIEGNTSGKYIKQNFDFVLDNK